MIPVKHIDPEDLPLYAMQLLTPDEMEEMSLHLRHSVEARRVLSEIYGDLSLFAQTAEMHDAPNAARQRLMKSVGKEKKVLPANPLERYATPIDTFSTRGAATSLTEEDPEQTTYAQKALPWIGWLIAAGLAAFAFTLHQQKNQLLLTIASVRAQNVKTMADAETANQVMETLKNPSAVHATLTAAEARPVPQGRVTYVPASGSLVFLASNMDPLEPAKTYELWVIPSDGRAPIPAGTFKPDARGNASVVLPQLEEGVEAKAFGVTIEGEGGSTVPTAPIIMHGLPT